MILGNSSIGGDLKYGQKSSEIIDLLRNSTSAGDLYVDPVLES